MNFPPSFIEYSEASFKELIKNLHVNAKKSLKELNEIDVAEFKTKSKPEQYIILNSIHKYLHFFEDKNLIQKLTALGLKKIEIRWFVCLSDIINQFTMIESRGIWVDKFNLMLMITAHLTLKFRNNLLEFFFGETVMLDEVQMTTLSQRLHKIKNRRRYGDGNLRIKLGTNNSESALQNFMNELYQGGLELMLEYSKGKTESAILKPMLVNNFDYDPKRISKIHFLSTLYDLFKIIMPDYNFATEAEFLETVNDSVSYKTYKANKLKQIILAKKDTNADYRFLIQ